MDLEVVKISKVEQSTKQGIKDVFAVALTGTEVSGGIPVHSRLTLLCESRDPLRKLVNLAIGDKRRMSLKAVNRELTDFEKPEHEEPVLDKGQIVLEVGEPEEPVLDEGQTVLDVEEPEEAVPVVDDVQPVIKTLMEWDGHAGGGTLEDYIVNNFKKDILTKVGHALHLAVPKTELPQKTAFNIAQHIKTIQTKQVAGAR